MGLRLRKSVKICKGVKINFSKSGASLSLGGRGHSMNFSGKGARATVGIPGTGMSYSTNLTGHHNSRSSTKKGTSSRTGNTTGVALPNQVQLKMSADGKVEILDGRGMVIMDQSVIRKIKATDSYKNTIQNLEIQRQQRLEMAFFEAKAENARFIEIHRMSPQVDRESQFIQIRNALNPPMYPKNQFNMPYPTVEGMREQLKREAMEVVHGNPFSIGKLRKDYVEKNFQYRLNQAIYNWEQEKAHFEAAESKKEIDAIEKYNNDLKYMNDIINGEDSAVNEAVESWISSCELPVEINVNYEWHSKEHLMYLDVDLPEIEDLPGEEVIRLANGNLKEKKKTQATLKQEYINLVFGLAIFISANVFNTSPAIHGIIISGYTQRKNRAGDTNDEYVYSIKFTRDKFENSVLRNVNSKDFCMRFENRSNITGNFTMKEIEPYAVV